jgi:hypothetical protein
VVLDVLRKTEEHALDLMQGIPCRPDKVPQKMGKVGSFLRAAAMSGEI